MPAWTTESVLIPVFYSPTWDEYVGGFYVDRFPICQPNATSTNAFPDVPAGSDSSSVAASAKPGVSPWTMISFLTAMRQIGNRNADERGWHLMTAWEYAVILEYCRVHGWMPHGNDHTSIPAASADDPTERGLLDTFAVSQGWDNYRVLPGTGPGTWTHNNDAYSGVYNLAGRARKPLLGFFADRDTGYAKVLANRRTRRADAPYGRSTSGGTGFLTDADKSWATDEFAGKWLLHNQSVDNLQLLQITSNSSNTLHFESATLGANIDYCILKDVTVDARPTGTGTYISSLWTTGEYAYYLIPATLSSTPSSAYHGDGYQWSPSPGSFPWVFLTRGDVGPHGTAAGMYATDFSYRAIQTVGMCWYYACLAI